MENKSWKPLKLNLKTHNYLGKLIVFDGLDGSGKTTLIAKLSKFLEKEKKTYILTKTPSDEVRNMKAWKAYGDESLGIPRSQIDRYGLSIIAFGDRLIHQKQIVEPSLSSGSWILCDRYVLTSLAYQSSIVHQELMKLLICPDLYFLLDVEPLKALERIKQRKNDRPPDLEESLLIRQRYLAIAKLNNLVIIETTYNNVQNSFSQIKKYTSQLL